MRTVLLVLLIGRTLAAIAQDHCRTREELIRDNVLIPAYDHGRAFDTSMYQLMRSAYTADRTSSYVAPLPVEIPVSTHDSPLVSGEGANGYLFEANVDLFFTLVSGRNDPHFFPAGLRIGTYFNNTVRMTKDESFPLLPGNWKIGLAGEFPIHLSHFRATRQLNALRVDTLRVERDTTATGTSADSIRQEFATYSVLESLRERNERVVHANMHRSQFVYGTWQLLHYSNGQDTGFYADKASLRNDYRSGDFSTNYAVLKVNIACRDSMGHLFTAGSGVRLDFGIPGAIAYSEEQEMSYGHVRSVSHVQWRTPPFWLKLPFDLQHVQRRFKDPENEDCLHRLREVAEFRARLEVEGILDPDLSRYPHTDKHRWGAHLWLELNTMRSYTTGFFFHAYYGRDYLNIRYDRAVWLLMGGVSFTIEKYIPFGWRPATTIEP